MLDGLCYPRSRTHKHLYHRDAFVPPRPVDGVRPPAAVENGALEGEQGITKTSGHQRPQAHLRQRWVAMIELDLGSCVCLWSVFKRSCLNALPGLQEIIGCGKGRGGANGRRGERAGVVVGHIGEWWVTRGSRGRASGPRGLAIKVCASQNNVK